MNPQIESGQATNLTAKKNNITTASLPPIDRVLNHVENVRKCGDGYRADCPIGHRSKGTLSLRESSDGTVLLKCHAGCALLEILHTIGLELSDLYERPTETTRTPRPSWQQRELMKLRRWRASKTDIQIEVNVLLLAAGAVYRNLEITREDLARMLLAGKRIRNAIGEL